MICMRCSKNFNEDQTDGICPKCSMYNSGRKPTTNGPQYTTPNTAPQYNIPPTPQRSTRNRSPKKANTAALFLVIFTMLIGSFGAFSSLFDSAFSESEPDYPFPVATDGAYNIPADFSHLPIVEAIVQDGVAVDLSDEYYYSGTDFILAIPEGTTEIAAYAFFYNDNIIAIIFPDSLQSIGDFAFYDANYIEYAHLPAQLSTVGDFAFASSDGRYSTLDIGTIPDRIFIGDYAFESVKPLIFPDNIHVEFGAFDYSDYSDSLYNADSDGFVVVGTTLLGYVGTDTDIKIPDNITLIDSLVFFENDIIETVVLPDSILHIGDSVFERAANLKTINFPDQLISIGHYAFYACESLESATLNEGLFYIGESVFTGGDALDSLYIPSTLQLGYSTSFSYNKWYYENHPFYGNFIAGDDVLFNMYVADDAQIITIPQGVKHLASTSIYVGEAVTEIIIPEGVESIQAEAFSSFLDVTDFVLEIPDSVTSIDGGIFEYSVFTEDNITVRCNEGSYAFDYAEYYDYPIIIKTA